MDCDKYWGDGAEIDMAPMLEEFYEEEFGDSSVIWTDPDDPEEGISEDLESRPEEYLTNGYTSSYEHWGQTMVSKALSNGCKTVDDIFKYITENNTGV